MADTLRTQLIFGGLPTASPLAANAWLPTRACRRAGPWTGQVIPDVALQTTIVEGLRALKRAPRRIDQLYANLPASVRAQVRDFLVHTPIHVTHGYASEVPKLPHVALVLRREEEHEPLLGQAVDPGPLAEEELLLRAADVGQPRPVPRDEPSGADLLLESRARAFPEEQPPLLYHERDLVESRGRIERVAYDAEVRTQDYFATAFLHRTLKAILIGAAPELEAWGIHALSITAGDVQHTGQEYPHTVFTRLLGITFAQVFAVHDVLPPLRCIDGRITAPDPSSAGAPATLSWQVTVT